MYSIYDKLNRIDDGKSLLEATRISKKKQLTESVEEDRKKLLDAAASVKCKLDDETIEYAMYDVDDFIENELVFAGNMLLEEHPEMLFWKYGNDSGINYNVGGYFEVYESNEEHPDVYYQIVHDRLYDITNEVHGDYEYDDDIDEMLTESYSNEMTQFMNWIQEYRNGALWDDFTAEFEAEQDPDIDIVLDWLEVFDKDAYYDYIKDDDIDEMLKENRNNPYFTPYGYRDAAKVLNGKAPEYYYHLKEIEMDRGDGVKLARYALRKGLPVMVDKNSDPDYPEFAIKGEYHWDDYFYPYPTAHEEDLVAWDGKMFV